MHCDGALYMFRRSGPANAEIVKQDKAVTVCDRIEASRVRQCSGMAIIQIMIRITRQFEI